MIEVQYRKQNSSYRDLRIPNSKRLARASRQPGFLFPLRVDLLQSTLRAYREQVAHDHLSSRYDVPLHTSRSPNLFDTVFRSRINLHDDTTLGYEEKLKTQWKALSLSRSECFHPMDNSFAESI